MANLLVKLGCDVVILNHTHESVSDNVIIIWLNLLDLKRLCGYLLERYLVLFNDTNRLSSFGSEPAWIQKALLNYSNRCLVFMWQQ